MFNSCLYYIHQLCTKASIKRDVHTLCCSTYLFKKRLPTAQAESTLPASECVPELTLPHVHKFCLSFTDCDIMIFFKHEVLMFQIVVCLFIQGMLVAICCVLRGNAIWIF